MFGGGDLCDIYSNCEQCDGIEGRESDNYRDLSDRPIREDNFWKSETYPICTSCKAGWRLGDGRCNEGE